MWKLPEKYRDLEILIRRLILFTLSLGLIVVYFSQILGIISAAVWICLPFIIGTILAFALNTFSRVVKRFFVSVCHIQIKPRYDYIYKILTTLILAALVSAFGLFIAPGLGRSIERVALEIPLHIEKMIETLYIRSVKIPALHEWLMDHQEAVQDIPVLLGNLFSFMTSGGAGDSLGGVKDILSSTINWIWIAFLSIVFSFIAFFNTNKFVAEGKLIAQGFLPEKIYESALHLSRMITRIFSQYLGGTVIECCILAALVSVFGTLFRIPNAILAGVFCGICALVPMFGATTGAILCSLVMLMDSPGKAVTFLIMFLCIQQVEGNFIYPNVVGKSVGLPAMYVVVAITIGSSLAGILGMVLSIPVATVIYELVTENARKRLAAKQEQKEQNS